jgi:hypothetical protein
MRIDDDGLAVLAELLAIAIFGHRAYGYYLVSCIGPDTESTVRTWKVSKNAARKKLAEIAQGSVESRVLFDGTGVMGIYAAPRHSQARALQSHSLGAPWQ